jgi:hypothetical protein
MIIKENKYGLTIRASKNDTYDWAHRTGSAWPCSTLSNKRIYIEESRNGDLVDLIINNGRGDQDVDVHELNAFIEDVLKGVKA